MMLDHIGQRISAQRIEQSVRRTLEAGRGLTKDLGGNAGTTEMGDAIAAAV